MRSRTAIWFECRIRYEKTMEDGMQKKVSENYVVDALSFSEAEERITEEMSSYVSGEFEIMDIKIAPYAEVFFADSDSADKWYKAKLAFITLDEKTQKEKKSTVNYLFNAGSMNGREEHRRGDVAVDGGLCRFSRQRDHADGRV